jgi:O-antigen/teichoic acid export membrane protein
MININIFRSHRFKRLFKEGFWIILGQVMIISSGIVGVRLITELLEPAAYGELALGMTLATFANQIVFGPLANGAMRFYSPAIEQNDLKGYLEAVRRMVLWATRIIIFVILFTVVCLLITGRTKWVALATIGFIFAILRGYISILGGIQNAARQRSIVAIHQGTESWARFIIAAGLILWLGATSTVAMIGYCMSVILLLVSQYIFFHKIISKNAIGADKSKLWREQIWKYSWPFATWGMFTWARLASDRWALEFFATTQDVGFYSVLFQLGYYPMSLSTGMATQFLAPIFFQRAGDASDSLRNANVNKMGWRLTGVVLSMTVLVFLLAFQFHVQIFSIIAAKEYALVSHLLPWMLLSGGLFAAGQTMGLNLMSQMKTRTMLAATIITALLGVIMNSAGAFWYGTTGVVMAGVLFSALYFFWMMVLSKKVYRNHVF